MTSNEFKNAIGPEAFKQVLAGLCESVAKIANGDLRDFDISIEYLCLDQRRYTLTVPVLHGHVEIEVTVPIVHGSSLSPKGDPAGSSPEAGVGSPPSSPG